MAVLCLMKRPVDILAEVEGKIINEMNRACGILEKISGWNWHWVGDEACRQEYQRNLHHPDPGWFYFAWLSDCLSVAIVKLYKVFTYIVKGVKKQASNILKAFTCI